MSTRNRKMTSAQIRTLTVASVAAGLALATTGPVSAASSTPAAKPTGSTVALGSGYMGVGYQQDLKNAQQDGAKAAAVTPYAAWGPAGVDVSHYQGTINWTSVKAAGISFAYIKATEGTGYKDPMFSTNYLNAYHAKVIRGAYHFAQPGSSSGAAQATYFAANGGAWSADNLTLPGMLDLEGGCYGLSHSAMQSWILDFYNTYKAKTTRDVVIYTSPSWWNTCTGGWSGMSARSPLFVADWTTASNPVIPTGFPYATIWQYTDAGSVSGISGAVDRDRFNGDSSRLLALANNT